MPILLSGSSGITYPNTTVGTTGNGPAFSAVPSGAQTGISSGVATKILFQTEIFDTNNNFSNSTFTPTVAGYYQINSCIQMVAGNNTPVSNIITIYKNGSEYRRGSRIYSVSPSANWGLLISDVVYLNGTTDYVEIYGFSNGGTWVTETTFSYFSGSMVRGA